MNEAVTQNQLWSPQVPLWKKEAGLFIKVVNKYQQEAVLKQSASGSVSSPSGRGWAAGLCLANTRDTRGKMPGARLPDNRPTPQGAGWVPAASSRWTPPQPSPRRRGESAVRDNVRPDSPGR